MARPRAEQHVGRCGFGGEFCTRPWAEGHYLCKTHVAEFDALTSFDLSVPARCLDCGRAVFRETSIRQHGICSACRKARKLRGEALPDVLPAAPPKSTTIGPSKREVYAAERAQQARQREQAKAEQFAQFIRSAPAHPVKKSEVRAALGGGAVLDRAIRLAVERGDIVSRSGGGDSGYYPAAQAA